MKKRQQAANDKRRTDLQRFITARKIKVARWAREAGISEGTIRNFLTKRSSTLTQATVDALVAAIGVPVAAIFPSMEKAQGRQDASALTFLSKSAAGFGAKDLPILPTVKAGGGVKLDHRRAAPLTERPEYLRRVKTAYALRITDETMSPAFEKGWLAYVDPTEKVKAGDNVVVELVTGQVVVRRLAGRSKGGVTLRQFNPKKDSEIKSASVASLHCIAGVRYRK